MNNKEYNCPRREDENVVAIEKFDNPLPELCNNPVSFNTNDPEKIGKIGLTCNNKICNNQTFWKIINENYRTKIGGVNCKGTKPGQAISTKEMQYVMCDDFGDEIAT